MVGEKSFDLFGKDTQAWSDGSLSFISSISSQFSSTSEYEQILETFLCTS